MLPFIKIGLFQFPTYILSWMTLFIVTLYILCRRFEMLGLEKNYAKVLVTAVFFFGLCGAKIYGMIKFFAIHSDERLSTIFFESGLGSYGFIVFGLITTTIFLKIFRIPILMVLDETSYILVLAVIFGRLACLLAGDGCYGQPTDLPWGMSFPQGVQPTFLKVHPTPFYEILAMLPVSILIWKGSFVFQEKRGARFAYSLLLISAVRFLSEYFRSTTYPRIYGFTIEQLIAIVFVLGSLGMLVILLDPYKICNRNEEKEKNNEIVA